MDPWTEMNGTTDSKSADSFIQELNQVVKNYLIEV